MAVVLERNYCTALSLVEMDNFETDCVLVDGKSKVRCHSLLLALVSDMCSSILPQPGEDKEDTIIILPDTGEEVLKLAVKLFYCGEVEYRGQTNQRGKISKLLSSLGREAVELKDIPVGIHENAYELEFGLRVQSCQPEHIVGPIYEDESDIADVSSDDSLIDNRISSDPLVDVGLPQHIIGPMYDDSEDDEEGTTFQADDAHQIFKNSAPRVTFQVTEKSSSRCCKFCHANCRTVYETWNPIQKMNLKALFEGDRSMDVKKNLLSHLRSQETVGLNTDGYHINNHTFCCSFLAYITDRSFFILKSV